jgi:hypothetical protein
MHARRLKGCKKKQTRPFYEAREQRAAAKAIKWAYKEPSRYGGK